jgi:hypothetical protein
MIKYKYRIVNNHRQYLTDSIEEYLRRGNYRGESVNIEMAPRDGWFDVNGNRCVLTGFGPNGESFESLMLAKVANWEYIEQFKYEEVCTLAHLTKKGLLDKERIAFSDGGSVPIICTYPDELGVSTNILLDITGKDKNLVRYFSKKWKNVISVL